MTAGLGDTFSLHRASSRDLSRRNQNAAIPSRRARERRRVRDRQAGFTRALVAVLGDTARRLLVGLCLIVSLTVCSFGNAAGQSPRPVAEVGGESIGIQGHYRAGHWTAVRLPPEVGASIELETTDGDGVAVFYEQDFLAAPRPGDRQPVFAYCVPGTEAAPLVIRSDARGASSPDPDTSEPDSGVRKVDRHVILKTRFPEVGVPAEEPSMIPVGMPWVVVIGDPLGIDTIGLNELLQRDASVAVSRVDDPAVVPDHVLGFSGVDLLLVTGQGTDILGGLSPAQGEAIENWVRGGGRLLVTLGASADALLQSAPWLGRLLPEAITDSSVVTMDPSGFETFTNSQTRLQAFDAWQFPKVIGTGGATLSRDGEVLIAGRTARRIGLPLAIRYTAGMGKITLVAADLDAAPFVDWNERVPLITKLTGDLLSDRRSEIGSSFRVSGYSDLSGQVRRSLDHFPIKRSIGFSVVALIIAALIALVAPLDYLFVRRVLGSSLLGWMSFPIVAVLLSIALVMAAGPRRVLPESTHSSMSSEDESLLRERSIEFLDIDSSTRTAQLFRWSYLYSHPAQTVSVEAQPSDSLAAIIDTTVYQVLYPFGAPSREMGGIQIDAWSSPIHVPITAHDPVTATAQQELSLASRIETLELAPRSSKSLAVQMQLNTTLDASAVQRRRGSELLQGELVNPFDVDLLDAMLVYQNWVYLLPTRFPAGAVVPDVDRLRQKNFRWQLSRQRALESSSETEAWDVTETNQPVRLAEMLMFHDAVGATRYTGLQNEILGRLDWTDLLSEDRCILVARCRDPWTTLSVQWGGDASTGPIIPAGEIDSWVRVILPVEEGRR